MAPNETVARDQQIGGRFLDEDGGLLIFFGPRRPCNWNSGLVIKKRHSSLATDDFVRLCGIWLIVDRFSHYSRGLAQHRRHQHEK